MFESSADRGGTGGGSRGPVPDGLLERLDGAVAAVLDRHPDELDETAIRTELVALERARRQVHARVCTLTATLTDRQAARARQAHPGDPRQAERAARETQTELADQLGWSPSEVKDHRAVGDQLNRSPATAEAMRAGELSAGHARHLDRTLRHLAGEQRRQAEARLLAVAPTQDVVTFGRSCQALLAELDTAAAERAETRRHARRRGSLTRTPDGMTALYGQWGDLDGELVETAVKAFRRPDAPDEHRTPEQRTADAIVDLARAALRAGEAPTRHGVRPHIVLTIAASDLRNGHGPVVFGSGRQVSLAAVREYLDDAGWSWMVVDADGTPMEAGPETRHVPVALWRGLSQRDGGCIADGCDAPPEWCDVMHLGEWHKDGGRLTLDTSALGCRTDHRHLDHHGWIVTWIDGRPILHHPDRPPRPRPRAGPDPGG